MSSRQWRADEQAVDHELAQTSPSSFVMQSEEIDVLAQVASRLRIPAVIVELRIFEWREELATKGRPVKRLASQVTARPEGL
jgi:hypothetical protein